MTGEPPNLNQMYVLGLAPSDDCDAEGETLELRFALSSTAVHRLETIVPGSWMGMDSVVLGETFHASDLTPANAVIYPSPDVLCTEDLDCAELGEGFLCDQLNPAHATSMSVCGHAIEVTTIPDSLRFTDQRRDQDTVLSMYYGGTLAGVNPEQGAVPPVSAEWQSDPDGETLDAVTTYVNLHSRLSGSSSRLCVSPWAGVDVVQFLDTEEDCFSRGETRALDQVSDLVTPWFDTERGLWSNVLALSTFYAAEGNSNTRNVILFTDGGDTATSSPVGGVDAVVAAAASVDMHVSVVHLDNLAHVPGHEAKYPGPTGAVSPLWSLACRTGGTYQVATDPIDLRHIYRSLGYGHPGFYEVGLNIPALRSDDLDSGAYRLAVTVTVSLHDSQKTYDFRGDTSSGDFGSLDDRRLAVFRP